MPRVTVAMITMNEEQAVGKVIDDISAALAGEDFEILIVDSSRDRTPEIAAARGARVLRQFPPKGYGRAMGAALTNAAGDVVVTLDCDDTYPADRILDIAEPVLRGQYDLISASRLKHRPEAMPLANYVANRCFAFLGRLLLGVPSTDLHTGMRAYSRALIANIDFDPNGPALPVELLLKPALLGYRVREVFIPYGFRVGSTTLNRWESTVWTFRRIVRLLPLRWSRAGARRVASA